MNPQQALYTAYNKKPYNFWKVITYSLWTTEKEMKFFICSPNEIFNKSFIGFKCKDEAHAHFIKDWLEIN